jgi:predicted esterase
MAAHMSETPPPMTARPDLAPSLRRAVMKCLEKTPGARYATADDFLADIEAIATPSGALVSARRPSGGRVLVSSAAVALFAAAVWFGTAGIRAKRWALTVGLSEVKRLTDVGQYDSAWYIAERVRKILPNDSTRTPLWFAGSRKSVLHSKPEGASVYRATFGDTTHWTFIGTTPTDTLWLPLGWGHLRVERAGYRTQRGLLATGNRTFVLDSVNAPNAEMAHIAGGTFGAFLVGLDNLPTIQLGDYFMDLHEVTNREYRAFVDAGGYTKREWWPPQIADGAKTVSWTDAMSRFVDKTGRPGPASWEAGSFPAGQADVPVSGVSWYEAAAYANFAGKSLPTIFHWARAAYIQAARFVVTGSNFENTALRRGSTWKGMSAMGVFDMAGNVREWCENDAGGGQRYILGGGYTESPYGFTDGYAQPAMDRSAINGIRLARYQGTDTGVAIARRPQPRAFSDYTKEHPVSDDVFRGYLNEFDYDHTALNAKLVSRDTSQEDWIEERVTIDAAYGKERMDVILLLPRHHSGPIQPVVYFPGSGVISLPNSHDYREQTPRFVTKTGRALVMPILKSTYERRDSLRSDIPDGSIFWRDHVVMWVKDVRRTLDYLSTRPDMDTTRFAYFGYSWGANQAPINLGVDARFKAAVLLVAGLTMQRGRPDVDPFNYLPRVKVPVLMLNGRYDFFFPVEVAQRPFMDNLGTPKDRKEWKIYEGGHDVPRTELIAETLKWLDKYLGPPQ